MRLKLFFTCIFWVQILFCFSQNNIGLSQIELVTKEQQIYTIRYTSIDSDDNKFVSGYFKGTISVDSFLFSTNFEITNDPSNDSRGVFVAKYNSLNELVWIKKISESQKLLYYFFDIDLQGNLFFTFQHKSKLLLNADSVLIQDEGDINIIKFDNNGYLLSKNIIANYGNETITCFTFDKEKNIYITGGFGNDNEINYPLVFGIDSIFANNYDLFIAKLDSNLSPKWAKSFGGTGYDVGIGIKFWNKSLCLVGSIGNSFAQSNVGGINITYPSNYYSKLFVSKLDTNGDAIWVRKFGNSYQTGNFDNLIFKSIDVNKNQLVYTGHSSSNYQNEFLFDGGPTLTGSSGRDYFIASYDTSGNFKWNTISQSIGSEYINELETDSNSNVYGVGSMNYTLKFPSDTLNSNGGDDVFVCSYDSNGQFRWAVSGGGAGADVCSGIAKDSEGKLWIVGGTTSSGGCYMGNDTLYPPANQSTLFYASLDSILILNQEPASIGQLANLSMSQFTVFPNPASARVEIKSQISDLNNASIELYNVIGQQVFNSIAACKSSTCNIDVSNLPNGMYFLQLKTTNGSSTQKIIVQH